MPLTGGDRTPAGTRLVLVGGLPGSGKSTVAEGLRRAAPVVLLSSDLVRRELDLPRDGRYDPAAVQRVYDVLLERAGNALALGRDVVLDASWTSTTQRQAAAELARRTGSRLVAVWCDVSDEVAEERLARRTADHPSDADPVVRRALAVRGAWPGAQTVRTEGPVHVAVAQVVEAYRRAGGPVHEAPEETE